MIKIQRMLLPISFAILHAPGAFSQQNTFEMGFVVCNDVMEPVPNATLTVIRGGTGVFFTCDSEGETSYSQYSPDQALTLVFEESPAPAMGGYFQATTIGQQLTISPAELQEFSGSSLTYYYFQPTARLLAFNSSSTHSTSDFESGCGAIPREGADYQFDCWMAELPTTESISRYFAHAVGSHSDLHQHGVLLRMDDNVDLGDNGFDLHIETDGYSYGSPPSPGVHAIYVGDHPGGNGLEVSVETLTSDQIIIHVRGELREGNNLVLLTQPDGGGSRWRAMDPSLVPTSPPPPASPGGSSCDPGKPTSDYCIGTEGTCDPDHGTAIVRNCPEPSCSYKYWWMGPQVCTQCGVATATVSRCVTFEGSLTAKLSIGAVGTGIEVGANGKASGTECQEVGPDPGHCLRPFICMRVCEQIRDVYWPLPIIGDPWVYWTDRKFACWVKDDQGNAKKVLNQMVCQFEDCDEGGSD